MKTNLLFTTDKVIQLDLAKIQKKIKKFSTLLHNNNLYPNENAIDAMVNAKLKQSSRKDITQSIASLINDLQYNINFREIYNIIVKNNPNNRVEADVVNLFEGLSMCFNNKEIIHQNVVTLYNIINQKQDDILGHNPFRRHNANQYENKIQLKIIDHNKIPSLFKQLIDFINNKNDLEPWISMQIIHIHSLAISPFEDKNVLFSKILSIWYWLTYGTDQHQNHFSVQTYLEMLKLNANQYFNVVKECLVDGDYTNFIEFIIDNATKYTKNKILITKIHHNLHTNHHLYLAEYEKNFLFVIVYYQMDGFDWKLFKKVTKWASSKQYIVRNLSKFVKYSLLISKNCKNRKFFYQSRLLRRTINNLTKTNASARGL